MSFPDALGSHLSAAAKSLGCSVSHLEYPNGGIDAPVAEFNVVIHLARELLHAKLPFHVYAEARATAGRVDLIGSDEANAIAVEVKTIGKLDRCSRVIDEIDRIASFSPSLTPSATQDRPTIDWWRNARARWGLIVLLCFNEELNLSWEQLDETRLTKPNRRPIEERDSVRLYRKIRQLKEAGGIHDRARFTDGTRWADCGEGWLLWVTWPLA